MEGPEIAGIIIILLILMFFIYVCLISLKKTNLTTAQESEQQV